MCRRFCRKKSTSAASRKHLKGALLVPYLEVPAGDSEKHLLTLIISSDSQSGTRSNTLKATQRGEVGVLSREGSGVKVIRRENEGRNRQASEQRRHQPRDKEDRGGGRGSRHTMLRSSCTNTPVNGYHLQGVRRHPLLPVYVYAVMLRVTPGFCCLGYPAKKIKNLCKFLMSQKKKRSLH